ncbi:MAG: T9SS type A sorting domain-containing protein [Bacteroidetes bacterium]|nr:T9SS type A sorting domain-containing protein [Bacteroidota bacterium]
MKNVLREKLWLVVCLLLSALSMQAQTTVTTGLVGSTTASASGVNVFGVTNSNTYSIAVTSFSIYHNIGTNNGRSYTVYYNPTSITGAPTITAANGWITVGTSALITSSSSQIVTVLSNQYVVIPPNTTYRFAIICNSGNAYFATTGNNTYANGNVTIQTGGSTVSAGYAGTAPSPSLTPRYFAGSISFVPASVNNIAAVALISPVSGTGYCATDSVNVSVVLRNMGDSSQQNFPVTARFLGATSNTLSGTYTKKISAWVTDTLTLGKINLPQGTYTANAFTQLSTDTIRVNDTTPSISFTFRKPVTLPIVNSDTVCPNGNANPTISGVANTVYRWFSQQSNGSLLNIGTSKIFPNLTKDSIMWIASDSAGCQSVRVPIGAIVRPAPAPFLGVDTAFCESIPLLLNAGYPGATYLWSTGDTTQTIQVANQSGLYWVQVTKYCSRSDSINVTVRPMPKVSGFSYIRMINTYSFNPSFVQNVTGYLWLFGDGTSSTDSNAVHTYALGQSSNLTVTLIVSNTCGSDTARKLIPTAVNDLSNKEVVSVYPNPAREKIMVSAADIKEGEIMLLNLQGSVIQKEAVHLPAEINVSTLPTGHYILKFQSGEKTFTKPIQIIR